MDFFAETSARLLSASVFSGSRSMMCNKTDIECPRPGSKRKLEGEEFEEIYVPPKRISPFLNTPKERKDERKRVLKICLQKLRQLDDPEVFLRRSVLINNTMKRLQSEVREEKAKNPKRNSRRKELSGYSVLSNSCLSNSYLFDDPFLSGIHEKITDDMTDTLVNNLHDKLCDVPSDSDSQHSDNVCTCLSANKSNNLCMDSQTNKSVLNNQISSVESMDFDMSPCLSDPIELSPTSMANKSRDFSLQNTACSMESETVLLCSEVPENVSHDRSSDVSVVNSPLNCSTQTTCETLTDGAVFEVGRNALSMSSTSVTCFQDSQQVSTNPPCSNNSTTSATSPTATTTMPSFTDVDSDYCSSIYAASVHYSLSMDQNSCSHSTCSFESFSSKPIGIVSAHSVLFTES